MQWNWKVFFFFCNFWDTLFGEAAIYQSYWFFSYVSQYNYNQFHLSINLTIKVLHGNFCLGTWTCLNQWAGSYHKTHVIQIIVMYTCTELKKTANFDNYLMLLLMMIDTYLNGILFHFHLFDFKHSIMGYSYF